MYPTDTDILHHHLTSVVPANRYLSAPSNVNDVPGKLSLSIIHTNRLKLSIRRLQFHVEKGKLFPLMSEAHWQLMLAQFAIDLSIRVEFEVFRYSLLEPTCYPVS